MVRALVAHGADVDSKHSVLAAVIRERQSLNVPLPSSTDVKANVSRLLRESSENHAAASRPILAVRRKTCAGLGAWVLCTTQEKAAEALGIERYILQCLIGVQNLPKKHEHYKAECEIEDYDPKKHPKKLIYFVLG